MYLRIQKSEFPNTPRNCVEVEYDRSCKDYIEQKQKGLLPYENLKDAMI